VGVDANGVCNAGGGSLSDTAPRPFSAHLSRFYFFSFARLCCLITYKKNTFCFLFLGFLSLEFSAGRARAAGRISGIVTSLSARSVIFNAIYCLELELKLEQLQRETSPDGSGKCAPEAAAARSLISTDRGDRRRSPSEWTGHEGPPGPP
jgi:hypothetical protein